MKIIVKLLIICFFNISIFSQSIEEIAAIAACECAKKMTTAKHEKYRDCLILSLIETLENYHNKFNYSVEEMQNAYQRTDSLAKSICDSLLLFKLNQNKINGVFFSFYPFNHYTLKPFGFKFYKDTLFVYEAYFNYEDEVEYNLYLKIENQNTVNTVKEFVQIFIIDKSEEIILQTVEESESKYANHTSLIIKEYQNGKITYSEDIVVYPEEEYHPKFLQLCDLFLSIAKEYSNKATNE
jgi:hypothetical protein